MNEQAMKVLIKKKADDPTCTVRVSVGGGSAEGGVYCVYRGDPSNAIAALDSALCALREMGAKEPSISPDDGKKYA